MEKSEQGKYNKGLDILPMLAFVYFFKEIFLSLCGNISFWLSKVKSNIEENKEKINLTMQL